MHGSQLSIDFSRTASAPQKNGLRIVSAADLSSLFDEFAAVLERHPLPAHEAEVVCIPHGSGMRTWLEQRLAVRLGCAASLYTPTVRELADTLLRRLPDAPPEAPFQRDVLTWRIHAFLSSIPDEAAFEPLRRYLGRAPGGAMPLSRRLARLYDSYRIFRPDLLEQWIGGRDELRGWDPARWQAPLWRLLAKDLDVVPQGRLEYLTDHLRNTDAPPAGMPRRLAVFGDVVLPPAYLSVLDALARLTEVTWYTIDALPTNPSDHPLADVLGQETAIARELRQQFVRVSETRKIDDESDAEPATALEALQRDIRRGSKRSGGQRFSLDSDDASLRVHDCHSPMRELEVLRDQLLDAFDSLEGLAPSDVIVVLSDVERYASLVDAVFSIGADETRLPYRIAHDPRGEGRRLLHAFDSLLSLLSSRMPASHVLELLAEPPVMAAAGVSGPEIEHIQSWIRATHIRWGADAIHKTEFDLPAGEANTWMAGIDRLLMGFVAGNSGRLVDGVLPYSEETLDRAELLGRFTLWVQDLVLLAAGSRARRTVREWSAWLGSLATRFLKAETEDEARADDHLRRLLADMDGLDEFLATDTAVDFGAVRDYLAESISGYEGGGSVLTGAITVSDFARLRHVPARVIACVGLNDDVFPGSVSSPDFDALTADPRLGDPDDRRLDKQRFLDAVLAASDRLILTYSGRSQKDNSERAPSIVLDALLDACEQTFTGGDASGEDRTVRDRLVVQHPLQPFSPAYFDGSRPELFSFDPRNCVALPEQRLGIMPFAGEALPAGDEPDDVISLDDLIRAWDNPSRFFCGRLGLDLRLDDATVNDIEPLRLDGLDTYNVRDTLLAELLAGVPEDEARERILVSGALPGGGLGNAWYHRIMPEVDQIRKSVERHGERTSVEIDVLVANRRLVGRVDDVTDDARLQYRVGRMHGKHVISAWIRHLALAASGRPIPSILIGTDGTRVLRPPQDALRLLGDLVEGYVEMQHTPVPVFVAASEKYAEKGNWSTASQAFCGSDFSRTPFDLEDPHVALLFRHRNPVLLQDADFAERAERLWSPIIDHSTTGT